MSFGSDRVVEQPNGHVDEAEADGVPFQIDRGMGVLYPTAMRGRNLVGCGTKVVFEDQRVRVWVLRWRPASAARSTGTTSTTC